MGKRIGFIAWVALGMVGGAVASIMFNAPPADRAVWMIFGLSFGMMFGFLFGSGLKSSGERSEAQSPE